MKSLKSYLSVALVAYGIPLLGTGDSSWPFAYKCAVVRTFAPQVELWGLPDEPLALPGNVDAYLEHATLQDEQGDVVYGHPRAEQLVEALPEESSPYYLIVSYFNFFETGACPLEWETQPNQRTTFICKSSCYVNFVEKRGADGELTEVVLQYIGFYPEVAESVEHSSVQFRSKKRLRQARVPLFILQMLGFGKNRSAGPPCKSAAFDHIDVHLKVDGKQIFFDRVYCPSYPQKPEGGFLSFNELAFNKAHPVVPFLPPGSLLRRSNTKDSKGQLAQCCGVWKCWKYSTLLGQPNNDPQETDTEQPPEFVPEAGHLWLFFKGFWGEWGGESPLREDWWRSSGPQHSFVLALQVKVEIDRVSHEPDTFSLEGKLPPRASYLWWRLEAEDPTLPLEAIETTIQSRHRFGFFNTPAYPSIRATGIRTAIGPLKRLYVKELRSPELLKRLLLSKKNTAFIFRLIVEAEKF